MYARIANETGLKASTNAGSVSVSVEIARVLILDKERADALDELLYNIKTGVINLIGAVSDGSIDGILKLANEQKD